MEASPRERLLDAADVLMYERGYEAVGVAELCRAADTRKGSFYHFFDSKQALALAMLDRSWERTRATLLAKAFDDASLTTLEAIQLYGELLVRNQYLRQGADAVVGGCRFGNFAVELSTTDDAVRDKIAGIFDEMTEIVAATIRRGIEAGELDPSIDAEPTARMIITHMQGLMVMAKAHRDPELLAQLGAVAELALAR